MSNKLIQRFYEIETEVNLVQAMIADNTALEVVQERVTALEAKQNDLKETVLHLIALAKLRDEAWQTLAYGMDA
ncbi:MAG: hypothetical protein KJ077_41245 [Anaerolineae bacterium]|nr:hypothetical protein [Anaerolineae bacterium]